MSRSLITVAMPVRNCRETLSAAVRSVLSQTFEDWELVIIDDGSTDGTLSSLQHFDDPRLRIHRCDQQKGLSARLNEIISGCTTTYLARMDGDDVSYPRRLEQQLKYLASHPDVDLVGSNTLVFGESGRPLGLRTYPEDHASICSARHAGFRIAHPAYLGKTSWFKQFRYAESALRCQDQELLLRSFRSSRFANVPEILLGYGEPRLELRKTLRSRLFFIKILFNHYLQERQPVQALWGTFGQLLRGTLDIVTAIGGLNHTTLTHQVVRATDAEKTEWMKVWKAVHAAGHKPPSNTKRENGSIAVNTTTPLVSVGIPFLNPGRLLPDAVRSVFYQTFKDWELILIDDGSTDGSAEWASRLSDQRIRFQSDGKNLGLPVRLNQIADLARGQYIARMDADDIMAPTRLAEQVTFLRANPHCQVVGTAAVVLNEQRLPVGARRIDMGKFLSAGRCLRRGMIVHPTIMGTREWFKNNRYDSAYPRAEDRELFARAFQCGTVAQLDKLLHLYFVPSAIRVGAFLQGYQSERNVVRRYGPNLVGWPRTVLLLLNSYLRSLLLPWLVKCGGQAWVARRLQGMGGLSPEEAAAASAILVELSKSPGLAVN